MEGTRIQYHVGTNEQAIAQSIADLVEGAYRVTASGLALADKNSPGACLMVLEPGARPLVEHLRNQKSQGSIYLYAAAWKTLILENVAAGTVEWAFVRLDFRAAANVQGAIFFDAMKHPLLPERLADAWRITIGAGEVAQFGIEQINSFVSVPANAPKAVTLELASALRRSRAWHDIDELAAKMKLQEPQDD